MWICQDFSDGDVAGVLDKLAARFQTVEFANDFKAKFQAAQKFNEDVKAGKKDEEMVWADPIEDVEEVLEDDIDTNKTADADGE